MYSIRPATTSPVTFAIAPDMPYSENAVLSSCGSNIDTISRNEAGMSIAPAIPASARKTKKEYLSGRNEMIKLRTPRASMP